MLRAPRLVAALPSALRQPAQAALWVVGVAQNYRLFNWIDSFNYAVHTEVAIQSPDGNTVGSSADLVPDSLRGALLTLNLVGKTWLAMPDRYRRSLADGIRLRAEARFCARTAAPEWVHWWADVQRITPDNAALERPRRQNLARFRCDEPSLPWWSRSKRR